MALYSGLQGRFTGAGVRLHGLDLLLAEQRPQRGLGGLDGGAVHHRGLEALPGRGAPHHAVLLAGAAVAGAGGRHLGRCLRVRCRSCLRRRRGQCRCLRGTCRSWGRGRWWGGSLLLVWHILSRAWGGVTRGGGGVHNTVLLLESPPQPSPERSSWLLLRPLLLLLLLLVHV